MNIQKNYKYPNTIKLNINLIILRGHLVLLLYRKVYSTQIYTLIRTTFHLVNTAYFWWEVRRQGKFILSPLVQKQLFVEFDTDLTLYALSSLHTSIFLINVPWTAEIVLPSCKHPLSICHDTLPGKAKGIELSSLQRLFCRGAIPLYKELGCSCEPAVKWSCLRKSKQSIWFVIGLFVSAICTKLHRAVCPALHSYDY